MDYHLPNMDNRGHLANYHLPHFVHVVIEQPLMKNEFYIYHTDMAFFHEHLANDHLPHFVHVVIERPYGGGVNRLFIKPELYSWAPYWQMTF